MDYISHTNELIENARAEALTQVRSYATPKKVASVIEAIISIAFMVGIQFISIGFDPEALGTYQFWVRTLSTTVGIFLLYRATINARFDATAKRENVVKARNQYNTYNSRKKLDFKEYLELYNLETKTKTYVAMIKRQYDKLERKEMKITRKHWNNEKIASRLNEIERQKEALSEKMSAEWLKNNIDKISIKYYVVYATDFNEELANGSHEINTRENYNQVFAKASVKKMWMFVFCTVLIALGMDVKFTNGVSIATSLVTTLLMMIVRIATALMEADKIYDSTITKSLIDRTQILIEYENWASSR